MPTAATYWTAAEDFAGLAARVAAAGRTLEPAGPIAAGRVAVVLDRAIADVGAGLGTCAAGYAALAAECRRRARACQAFTSEVRAYERWRVEYEHADPLVRATMPILLAPHGEPWMTPD